MNFKKTYKPKNGYTPISKIGECSLKMLALSQGRAIFENTNTRG